MGYDVTFHAISKKELKKYVFDVLEEPNLAADRAKEMSEDEEKQDEIQSIYGHMLEWIAAGPNSGDDFAKTFSFAIAALSGFLHEYYYSRNFALSLLNIDATFFQSFTSISDTPISKFNDRSGGNIIGNYSASGFSDNPKAILTLIEQYDLSDFEDGEDSLKRMLAYCINNDLLFFEASDIVVPFSNESFTDRDQMKAHYLDNITDS